MVACFYCPTCWKEINRDTVKCPHCRYDLAAYAALSYEDKLIYALRHPIRENRMMAIQLLGEMQSHKALTSFASTLEKEQDFYVIREIIRSLDKIGTKESRNMIRRLHTHRSKLVRKAVEQTMPDMSAGGAS